MKLRFLFLALCVGGLAACGQKKESAPQAASPPADETPKETVAAPKVPAETAPKNASPKSSLLLTPEISAATVCVRINIASTRQKAYTGIILAADAIDPPLDSGGNNRLVAALMPDCDESLLRDKSCITQILRNKGDGQNNAQATPLKAALLNFDPKTHVAFWLMSESFASRLDPGLAASQSASNLSLLLTHFDVQPVVKGDAAPAVPPPQANKPFQTPPNGPRTPQDMNRRMQEMRAQQMQREQQLSRSRAVYSPIQTALAGASLSGNSLQADLVPDAMGEILDTAAVLDTEGKVSGFAQRQASGSWQYVLLGVPKVVIPKPHYVARSLQLKYFSETAATLLVHGDLEDPFHELGSNRILWKNANPTEFRPVEPGRNTPLLDSPQTLYASSDASGDLTFIVELKPEEMAGSFQLQVVLQKKNGGEEELCHSAPFLAVLKRRGSGLYLTTQGVESSGPLANEGEKTGRPSEALATGFVRREVTTESPILYAFPIAEGREELIRLEQAPYWKRLSLAKAEWLRLPDVDLSTAKLAGNKEALFVWLPALHEIRRYGLADLALEGSVKLPAEIAVGNLTAGACSSGAPVALVTDKNVLACDPKTLACDFIRTIRPEHDNASISSHIHFMATGDGMGIKSYRDRNDATYACPEFLYRGPLIGFSKMEYGFNADTDIRFGTQLTVAPSFLFANNMEYPGTDGSIIKRTIWESGEVIGTFANSPTFFVVGRHNGSLHSNTAPLFSLYSDFSKEPVLQFEAPEILDLPSRERDHLDGRAWFDPYSLSVALWHFDKTITLRGFDKSKLPVPRTPALLNYPDTFVSRGGTFRFTPLLLGDAESKLSVANAPAGLRASQEGALQWECGQDVPMDELNVGVAFQNRGGQVPGGFSLPLRISGVRPALALGPDLTEEGAVDAIGVLAKESGPKPTFAALNSRVYHSDRPIHKVLSALEGYIPLQFLDGTLGLYSTKEGKVTVLHQFEPNASLFPAGNAIFSYNPANRTLTRYLLPQLTPGGSLTMPGSTQLTAIGLGSASSGPVTLFLEGVIARERFMDLDGIYTFSYLSHALRIVDMDTLREGKWAQFTPYQGPDKGVDTRNVLEFMHGGPDVLRLPTSADGRVVVFPSGRLLVTPTITTDCPSIPPTPNSPSEPLAASATGDRIFGSQQLYVSGMNGQQINYPLRANMSPCGNFVAQTRNTFENPKKKMAVSILSTENLQPLLLLPELDVFKIQSNFVQNTPELQLYPMGDKNLLTFLSQDGSTLQVIDFNFPEIYKKVVPESAVVISHPFPAVAAGNTMTYQIQVNNPDKVTGYQLRNPVEGAQVDNTGKFTYRAPQEVGAPFQVNVVVDIKLANGKSVAHSFPIAVISLKAKQPPTAKGKPGTTI